MYDAIIIYSVLIAILCFFAFAAYKAITISIKTKKSEGLMKEINYNWIKKYATFLAYAFTILVFSKFINPKITIIHETNDKAIRISHEGFNNPHIQVDHKMPYMTNIQHSGSCRLN